MEEGSQVLCYIVLLLEEFGGPLGQSIDEVLEVLIKFT
jgi:hypothetical protein